MRTLKLNLDRVDRIGLTATLVLGAIEEALEEALFFEPTIESDGYLWVRITNEALEKELPFLAKKNIEMAVNLLNCTGEIEVKACPLGKEKKANWYAFN